MSWNSHAKVFLLIVTQIFLHTKAYNLHVFHAPMSLDPYYVLFAIHNIRVSDVSETFCDQSHRMATMPLEQSNSPWETIVFYHRDSLRSKYF